MANEGLVSERVSDVAFSPAVKAIQARLGSRSAYERKERNGGWRNHVTPELAAFIAERDSLYLATASASGQPYIQHRGGPKGFLAVIDDRTLGIADFGGNKQYITIGNLSENDKAYIFLMDYANQSRIKLWGRARVIENDPDLVAKLAVPGYEAKLERAILFTIEAWDSNCRQHIVRRFTEEDILPSFQRMQMRIDELEAEVARLRATHSPSAI